jgi:hypothetical protein
MSRYLFAERKAGEFILSPFDPDQPANGTGAGAADTGSADAGSADALVMSRLDFDLQVTEVPAAAEREIEGFLRYRIPSLYPGDPQSTEFDYRLLAVGRKKYAILFLCQQQVLAGYRRVAGGKPLLLPFNLVQPFISRRRARPQAPVVFSFWHRSWIDNLAIRGGDTPRPFVVNRSPSAPRDFERLQTILADDAGSAHWVVFCSDADRDALRNLPAGPQELHPIGEAVARAGRRPEPLFAPRRRPSRLAASLRVQALLAAVIGVGLLALKGSVDRDERYQEALRARLGALEQRMGETAALQKEIAALEGELAALRARRPVDPYWVLSELESVLKEDTRIQSFILEKDVFQLEAVGRNPLRLMEEFKGKASFKEVRMIQIIPMKESREELFRITGRVKRE